MNDETPTPRTDAVENGPHSAYANHREEEGYELARQLERELAQCQRERDELRNQSYGAAFWINERDSLRSQLASALRREQDQIILRGDNLRKLAAVQKKRDEVRAEVAMVNTRREELAARLHLANERASKAESDLETQRQLKDSLYNTGKEELAKLSAELEKSNEKLAYVHSMGLRFGLMKTSDKPEPYLAHTWTEDSDHERMFRDWSHSIGWEEKLAKVSAELESVKKERDEAREDHKRVIAAHGEYIGHIRELMGMKTPGDGFIDFLTTTKRELDTANGKIEELREALREQVGDHLGSYGPEGQYVTPCQCETCKLLRSTPTGTHESK